MSTVTQPTRPNVTVTERFVGSNPKSKHPARMVVPYPDMSRADWISRLNIICSHECRPHGTPTLRRSYVKCVRNMASDTLIIPGCFRICGRRSNICIKPVQEWIGRMETPTLVNYNNCFVLCRTNIYTLSGWDHGLKNVYELRVAWSNLSI